MSQKLIFFIFLFFILFQRSLHGEHPALHSVLTANFSPLMQKNSHVDEIERFLYVYLHNVTAGGGVAADVTATKGYLQRGRRRRSPSCDSLSTWGVGGRRVRDFSDWTGQRVGGRSHSNIFTDSNKTEVTFCIYTQHKLFFLSPKKKK